MPPGQSQPPLFSQSVQQFLPPPAQAGHAAPSLYPQSSMPITSGMAQPQTTAPSHGVSFSSSYTYAPSSFGLLQTSISMPPQFQPSSQMPTPVGPTETQPWMPSNGGTPVVASLQQGSLQAFPTSTTVPRPNGSSEGHQQMLSFSSPNTQHLTLPYYQHTSNAFTRNTVGWGAFHLGFPNTDPEQGRCRRTDGKKWRCSRDAVADQKYCERHMNRGRHRSRKLVEGQTGDSASATTTTNGKLTPIASATSTSVVPAGGLSNSVGLSHHHQLSNLQPSSNNHVCGIPTINRSLLDKENANGVYEHTTVLPITSPKVSPKDNQLNAFQESSSQEFGLVSDSLLNPLNGSSSLVNCRNYGASDNLNDHHNKSQHAVRQFKDDWPKNQSECTTIAWRNVDLQPDRTQLSISIPVVASDFMSSTPLPVSEKLTSSPPRLSRELEMGLGMGTIAVDGNQRQTNWVPISLEPSMGGPLGEVLHTTSNSAGNCKNTKPLNLIDSWDSSPWLATSPTGVLQRGAFRFLSNSSAASSPRAESSKIHDGACLCDGLINPGLINSSLPAL